jgi:hypothetical protein
MQLSLKSDTEFLEPKCPDFPILETIQHWTILGYL